MGAAWTGILFCGVVIYFGIVNAMSNPWMLLNVHAVTLVVGGTAAIATLTYSPSRLKRVLDYVTYGFLFRFKRSEMEVSHELLTEVDRFYGKTSEMTISKPRHPFLREAIIVLNRSDVNEDEMESMLRDRRDMIRRRYVDDARILHNISKYPPNMGLLGAATGMIQMMTGLGTGGVDTIGAAMATALTATLWGIGLNNFVFLPLADNSLKVAEDEIHLRDMIIDCCLAMKRGESHMVVIGTCLNRLSFSDHRELFSKYQEKHGYEQINKVS